MIVNIIGFNASWFGLIFFNDSFIGPTLLWLCLHLYLSYTVGNYKAEFALMVSVILLGILVDSIMLQTGIFLTNDTYIPLWLITLWAAFSATISHSLRFLERSKILQFIVGAIFPPLSYIAGANLSAVRIVELDMSVSNLDIGLGEIVLGQPQIQTFLILSPVWAVLFLLFFSLKKFFYTRYFE